MHIRACVAAAAAVGLVACLWPAADAKPAPETAGAAVAGGEAPTPAPPLSLESLFAELRRESKTAAEAHLGSMLLVASYGHRLYNLNAELSGDCARSLAAAVAMTTDLCAFRETDAVVSAAMADAYDDVVSAARLEHPLELLCRRVEQRFLYASAADAPLYARFARAKARAANRTLPAAREPYLVRVSGSERELAAFHLHALRIPQMAKFVAHDGFEDQLYAADAYNRTFHSLAQAMWAVARTDEYKGTVQRLYDETLEQVADYISRTKYEKLRLLDDNKTYWFSEIIMAKLKERFDQNPILKAALQKQMEETNG